MYDILKKNPAMEDKGVRKKLVVLESSVGVTSMCDTVINKMLTILVINMFNVYIGQ